MECSILETVKATIESDNLWGAAWPYGRQADPIGGRPKGQPRYGMDVYCQEPGCRQKIVAVCDFQVNTEQWCNRGLCGTHGYLGEVGKGLHLCETHRALLTMRVGDPAKQPAKQPRVNFPDSAS